MLLLGLPLDNALIGRTKGFRTSRAWKLNIPMEPQVALDSEACLHPVNILIKDGDFGVTASVQNHDVQLPGVVLCFLFCSFILFVLVEFLCNVSFCC